MLGELGGRDRLVMSGLVVLGLLTVVAGVVSGHSTAGYVLNQDARKAGLSWANAIDAELAEGGTHRVLNHDLTILDAAKLREQFSPLAHHDSKASADSAAGDDRRPEPLKEDHVSRLDGVALFGADRTPLAATGDLTAAALQALLARQDFVAAMQRAVTNYEIEVAAFGTDHHPVVFVPVAPDGKVERVYAVKMDQSTAASFTNVALTVVTVTTSLLIVMGFSIPAAIASRRIRERWLAEDQIHFLAMHDSLTGLPNRVQLRQHLERAIARGKRHNQLLAVLCLDLDRFKSVNDTLGHATGDALLAEVAARLKETLRETDLVGRLGGDEFAIIAEDLETPDDAVRLARRVCTALSDPYRVNGHEVTSSVSVGIALGPAEGEADILMKNADLALYRAKQDGRNTFRFFEPAMDAALQRRQLLEHDLRQALRKNELSIDYQPQFSLESGKLTGYEALARWWHPTEGDVPPTIFVPIAEETGLIGPLGEWMLRTACAHATSWPPHTTLAVNLSPAQFKTQDVVGLVARILAETGLDPRRLELEITERILLHNTDTVLDALKRLDRLGVSIAMDDFGTGYSSLSYLTRFPVRKIKIDRSFIDTLGVSPQTSAIVSSIVGLGQSLQVTITAEGVETEDQAEILRQWGCDQVQGFFCGKPENEVPDCEDSPLDHPLVA